MNLIEQQSKEFQSRHIGTSESEMNEMLHLTGEKNLDELVDKTIPSNIKNQTAMQLPSPM
ncbi:MAG: hypothetical protein ACK5AB_06290, partial [Bacteroidota bacterium]